MPHWKKAAHNNTVVLIPLKHWVWVTVCLLSSIGFLLWAFTGTVQLSVRANGLLLADGGRMVSVPAMASGTVTAVHVKSGDAITAGQILATLSNPYAAERRDYFKRAYEDQRLAYEHYKQWSSNSLADLDRQELAQAHAYARVIEQQKETIQYLLQLYQKQRGLFQKHYISKVALENAHEHYKNAKAKLSQLRLEAMSKRGNLKQTRSDITMHKTQLLQATLSRKHDWDKEKLSLALGESIQSPVAGKVISTAISIGESLRPTQTCMTVMHGGHEKDLLAIVFVSHLDAKKIKAGMPARILPDSMTAYKQGYLKAVVKTVSPLPMSKSALRPYLGNPDLVNQYFHHGAPIFVSLRILKNKHGLQWTMPSREKVTLDMGSSVTATIIFKQVTPVQLLMKG